MRVTTGALAGLALMASFHAKADDIRPAGATDVFPVWTGIAPGSESATWQEVIGTPAGYNGGHRWIRNVTVPTLTAFLPDPSKASGAAIVIAPGGGFRWLAIDTEGYNIGRWLQERGVAAFVLKYRLAHTPESETQFKTYFDSFVAQLGRHPITNDRDLGQEASIAVADGLQAMRVVRQRSADWKLDPKRIGFMGFSAGGQITNAIATGYDPDTRPNFAASIYGIPSSAAIPADAPPLFLAAAADDPAVLPAADISFFQAWRAGGHSAELHLFASGGHGFGDAKQEKTSDHWLDEFLWWLDAQGVTKPRP